jgi:hypothetical protein
MGDVQRWLMRAGARSIGRDVADRVKRTTFGGGAAKRQADVWETATTEPPLDEPPECQWCPICRAARKYRESGGTAPGFSGQFAGVGDTLAGLTRDAFSLFETAMRPPQRPANRPSGWPAEATAEPAAPSGWPKEATAEPVAEPVVETVYPTSDFVVSDDGTVVGPGVGWPTVVHPQHEDYEPANESPDGQESGEAGDGHPDGGTDKQVEGSAE